MARKNPLGKIKDVAVGTLKAPVTATESAVTMAKGAASAGLAATGKAAGAVTSLVGGQKESDSSAPAEPRSATTKKDAAAKKEPAAKAQPAKKEPAVKAQPAKKAAGKAKTTARPTEPVNVTDELGLDPAPVDKPKTSKTAKTKPVTKIDAAADPSKIDATPADVAEVIASEGSVSNTSAK